MCFIKLLGDFILIVICNNLLDCYKKSTKVIRGYPEGLYPSDIGSITYRSSKTRVATVNKKGVIKGKRKGKAVIAVTVRLADINASKAFKIRITVGKRKVVIGKITSQKAKQS